MLQNNPSVVGYDLINEPYVPQGNAQKLWTLYRKTIAAIREVDAETPIIVESPGMASPDTLPNIPIFADSNVIYSFHYYEPFPYFSPPLNQGRMTYPGPIPTSEGESPVIWNEHTHRARLSSIKEWQVQHEIEPYRVFVGEFGVWRKANGAKKYLQDVTALFSEYGWSWSYYAFRENDWDVADLELEGSRAERHETELFQTLKHLFR